VKSGAAKHNTIEAERIIAAQCGDRNAFTELVHQYREGVVTMVYRMVGDIHLAEDAAQDTFLRAWINLSKYKPSAPFRNWLYRIAYNRTLDLLRQAEEEDSLDSIPLASKDITPEVNAIQAERVQQIQKSILELPSASRIVLVLREYQGLSYQEIAAVLNIPIGTVMSRLSYARNKLIDTLQAHLEDV